MSWEFESEDLKSGTISCVRAVGGKDIPVDVIRLSETPRLLVYACAEGEELSSADLVGEWTDLEDGLELQGVVGELLAAHGMESTLTLGLANWGTEDIELVDPSLGLAYVVDHGDGFQAMTFPGTDDRTVFPGTMGLFVLDPEGAEEGFMTLDLQDGGEIVIAWGEEGGGGASPSGSGNSSGCNGAGGLPLALLVGLPLLALLRRRQV